MSRFDDLVATVARTKRRVERVGVLLMCAEGTYVAAVRELDRAIAEACRAPVRKRRAHKCASLPCGKLSQKGNTVASQASNDELQLMKNGNGNYVHNDGCGSCAASDNGTCHASVESDS